MIEVVGNLWTYPADVRVITTNGFVKKNGECVMGRGCAKEAVVRQSSLPKLLGRKIQESGNHVHYLGTPSNWLFSFPVKHNWWERADPVLIERSARQLVTAIDYMNAEVVGKGRPEIARVVMPRPGCGNGQLNWDDIRPILAPILDDRFHVITFA